MNLDRIKLNTNQTTATQIEWHLREAIVQLALAPGTKLSEQEIANSLGVSRQPVREALIALAKSQLVDIRRNRGTIVARISAKRMAEARFVREALEAAVARRACSVFDTWTRRKIDIILAKQQEALEAEDRDRFRREDEQFHIAIAHGAGCELAWTAIADLKAHMDRVCNLQLRNPPTIPTLIQQHRDIIAAIDAKDADAAEAAMRVHLNGILSDLPQIEADYPDLFE